MLLYTKTCYTAHARFDARRSYVRVSLELAKSAGKYFERYPILPELETSAKSIFSDLCTPIKIARLQRSNSNNCFLIRARNESRKKSKNTKTRRYPFYGARYIYLYINAAVIGARARFMSAADGSCNYSIILSL